MAQVQDQIGFADYYHAHGGRVYDHQMYVPGTYHFIIRDGTDRKECDDSFPIHKDGTWRVYIR